MKVNLNQPITDLLGKEIKDGTDTVTYRATAMTALLGSYQDEASLSGEKKLKRYKLAGKIAETAEGEIDLTLDEVALLRELINKAYSALVVGRFEDLLDK